jgi:hypothetical protein
MRDCYDMLAEAEEWLGGFMGSRSGFRRVEELREEIRQAIKENRERTEKREGK